MIGLPRETFAEVQGIVDLGFRAREIGRGGRARALHGPRRRRRTSCRSRTRRSSGRACRARPAPREAGVPAPGDHRPAAAALAARHPHLAARGRARSRRRGHGRRASRRPGAPARASTPGPSITAHVWHDGVRGARARRSTTRRRVSARRSSRSHGTTSGAAYEGVPARRVVGAPRGTRDGRLPLGRVHGLRGLHGPRAEPAGVVIDASPIGLLEDRTPLRRHRARPVPVAPGVRRRPAGRVSPRRASRSRCRTGMRPKPVISLAIARAVGVASLDELMTVELVGDHDPDDVARAPRGDAAARARGVARPPSRRRTPRPVSARLPRLARRAARRGGARGRALRGGWRRRPSSAPRRSERRSST